MMEAIIIFLLITAFIGLTVDHYKVYKEKEYYRCRVFDLTDGKEGRHLPDVPDCPPPPAPKAMLASHPLFIKKWFRAGRYIFLKSEVKAFYRGSGGKYVFVFKGGGSVDTDITNEDDVKWLLGIDYVADIKEELIRRDLPECPERKITEDHRM